MRATTGGRRVRARDCKSRDVSRLPQFAGGGRISRAALLAGASLIALGAIAAPRPAQAACSGTSQTISTSVSGPVFTNSGSVSVVSGGTITGAQGVVAIACSASTVEISLNGAINYTNVGIVNENTITTLSNSGKILSTFAGATGAYGVFNTGTIGTLTNSGTIDGANGTGGGAVAGNGGSGVYNSNTITTLTNSGMITGGAASSVNGGATGGAGVYSAGSGSQITNFTNQSGGQITGGGATAAGAGNARGGSGSTISPLSRR
jgi:hypothetical protein